MSLASGFSGLGPFYHPALYGLVPPLMKTSVPATEARSPSSNGAAGPIAPSSSSSLGIGHSLPGNLPIGPGLIEGGATTVPQTSSSQVQKPLAVPAVAPLANVYTAQCL